MRYVDVLPLTATGKADNVFTYETELEPVVGSLVSVPLRNRLIRGMVLKYRSKPEYPTRPIKKILSDTPVLSSRQLKLAEKIAAYYFAPISEALSAMLPFDFGKKRRPVNITLPDTKKASPEYKLTEDQKKIYSSIEKAKPGSKHLIFGVTGSGKTEIYIRLIEKALSENKTAIILVPEISLTPQAKERFTSRFGEIVALWHSGLLETEKYATWEKIKSGGCKVVLGARSAIFAPLLNLGYIIIDEEHEGSYKQDQNPRYETARVAEWLSDLTGAKLVLGSATPRVDTFFKTAKGSYALHQLKRRIVQEAMPPVKVVDLRDEFKKGNRSIISDDLYEAANEALKGRKQVMLFVNRRGASTFVVCRDCGFVSECPNCEIPLTYHPSEGEVLKCHHCEYRTQVPVICPTCRSHAIRYFGLGTQRTEIEIKKMFPKAKVLRMDRDTTRKRGSHESLYSDFAQGKADILIGTQIIAKGWDLPDVAVVGVISADTMLNLPDFRSGERTFSLLTQVAGRTGRGYHPGKVIIQTYNPESYAIKAAAKHDFLSFYERELTDRKKYGYPPFSNLIKLVYAAREAKKAEDEAKELAEHLESHLDPKTAQILGPTSCFLPKLAGKYRFQIILKIKNEKNLEDTLSVIKNNYKTGWTVDVNPESLL